MLATFAEFTVINPVGSVGKYLSRFSPIEFVASPAPAMRVRADAMSAGFGISTWYGEVTARRCPS